MTTGQTAGMSFDIAAYLARIGHTGDHAPTHATLRAVHLAHATTIAFENLDALTGRVPPLDAAALAAKLVHGARGGWCFEHNRTLQLALDALGYRTTALAARVLWNVAPEVIRPRSHMLLLVHLDDGDHLADVGFGGLTLTAPLRLVADAAQPTPHEPFRLVAEPGGYRMEALAGDAWKPLYRFDLAPQLPVDYEVSSWYLSTHPASHFRRALIAARPERDGRRHTLADARLTTRWPDGRTDVRTLDSADALRGALGAVFGIAAPDDADGALRDAVERTRVSLQSEGGRPERSERPAGAE